MNFVHTKHHLPISGLPTAQNLFNLQIHILFVSAVKYIYQYEANLFWIISVSDVSILIMDVVIVIDFYISPSSCAL